MPAAMSQLSYPLATMTVSPLPVYLQLDVLSQSYPWPGQGLCSILERLIQKFRQERLIQKFKQERLIQKFKQEHLIQKFKQLKSIISV